VRACARIAGAAAVVVATACGELDRATVATGYVGSTICAGCHGEEHAAWVGSPHALGLRFADPGTVQAPFDGAIRGFASLPVRPVRRGAGLAFEVASDSGPTRELALAWVVGGAHLEQFLTATAGGRLQALPIGYDTAAAQWFDIFPEAPAADEWSHWTGPGMTANGRCLVCHTTGFEKGYREATDTYDSRWAEPGVGCEACHGPGASHVAARRRGEPDGVEYGAIANREQAMRTCAPCHVRGVEAAPVRIPGDPLVAVVDPELLDTDVYYADGQVRDEAFEWTSFQLSRMASHGVVCQDCHETHRARLRAEGDALCLGCHADSLAMASHTHHAAQGEGARCVGCHMPASVFMERDVRRDHRIAAPDPAGAEAIGAPDPCTRCHVGRSAAWAAGLIDAWYGGSDRRARARELARLVAAARAGEEATVPELLALLRGDGDAVHRASAARLLGRFTEVTGVVEALGATAADTEPLVRVGAAAALSEAADTNAQAQAALLQLVDDPVRLVRARAGFGFRAAAPTAFSPAERAAVERAVRDWGAVEDVVAERPEAAFNRGVFLAARGDPDGAESAYRRAIGLWPAGYAARQNLAMLLAATGRDDEAEREWQDLRARAPQWAPAAFSLGLLYGRQGRWREAAVELEACLAAAPSYPRARSNLAHAYDALGYRRRALELREIERDFP
jgi:predicted CXXCH cytochrome family protein